MRYKISGEITIPWEMIINAENYEIANEMADDLDIDEIIENGLQYRGARNVQVDYVDDIEIEDDVWEE